MPGVKTTPPDAQRFFPEAAEWRREKGPIVIEDVISVRLIWMDGYRKIDEMRVYRAEVAHRSMGYEQSPVPGYYLGVGVANAASPASVTHNP